MEDYATESRRALIKDIQMSREFERKLVYFYMMFSFALGFTASHIIAFFS